MPIDLDKFRDESRQDWNDVASGWEARREWLLEVTRPVSDWLIDKASPQPGETFLEIACGTGDLGRRIAESLGDDGRVISTDFAPEMLDTARRIGEAHGAANVEYRVLDAERMDLDDASVDGAVCRFGYMLMADPAAALTETRRVLRDGGRLAFAVWGTPDRNPWVAMPFMTLVQRGVVPPPEPGAPGILALGDSDLVRSLVTGAGFGDLEMAEIEFAFHYADFEDYWDAIVRLAGALATAISDQPADEQQAIAAAVRENAAGFRQEDGSYVVPAMTWGVLAR
jgi:ubiquinone/menaquinone biosynthesis C-methylase UbiE